MLMIFCEVTRICEYLWHVVYHDIMKYGWGNTPNTNNMDQHNANTRLWIMNRCKQTSTKINKSTVKQSSRCSSNCKFKAPVSKRFHLYVYNYILQRKLNIYIYIGTCLSLSVCGGQKLFAKINPNLGNYLQIAVLLGQCPNA